LPILAAQEMVLVKITTEAHTSSAYFVVRLTGEVHRISIELK